MIRVILFSMNLARTSPIPTSICTIRTLRRLAQCLSSWLHYFIPSRPPVGILPSALNPLECALTRNRTHHLATPVESTRFFKIARSSAKSLRVTLVSTTLTKHTPRNPIRMNTSAKHQEHPSLPTPLTILYSATYAKSKPGGHTTLHPTSRLPLTSLLHGFLTSPRVLLFCSSTGFLLSSPPQGEQLNNVSEQSHFSGPPRPRPGDALHRRRPGRRQFLRRHRRDLQGQKRRTPEAHRVAQDCCLGQTGGNRAAISQEGLSDFHRRADPVPRMARQGRPKTHQL